MNAANSNSRLPLRGYEVFSDQHEQELSAKERITMLELENSKLRNQVNNEREERKLESGMLKHQLNSLRNSKGSRTMFQDVHPPLTMDSKLDNIGKQLELLLNAHHNQRNQMHILVNAASKQEVFNEEFRKRLAKIEDAIGRGWMEMDTYEYGDHGARRPTSPQYNRREYNSSMMNDISEDQNIIRTTAPVLNVNCSTGNNIGLSDMPGNVYTSAYGESLISPVCNDTSAMSASISMDRRQSDSTTTNTIESGYCDEREEVFDFVSSQNGGLYDPVSDAEDEETPSQNEGLAGGNNGVGTFSTPVIIPNRRENDIEFVGQFQSQKKSGEQNTSIIQARTVESEHTSKVTRRASVFSRIADDENPPRALVFDMDFDDACENNVRSDSEETQQAPLDPEIDNLNEIFENSVGEEASEVDGNSNDASNLRNSPFKRKKDSASSNEQPKRIRGIAKAPIKQEPRSLNIFTRGSVNSVNLPSKSPPLLEPPPAKFMETLRNIKKERVAHALDAYYEPEKVWRCICGHQTTTRNGIKLHVKHMGTEEARYMCPWQDCDGRFVYPFLVRNHLVRDHKDNTIPDKLYGCDKCYKIFYDKTNLQTHKNDRNETCKSTPRRNPNPGKQAPRTPFRPVAPPTENQNETLNRPSIIITL